MIENSMWERLNFLRLIMNSLPIAFLVIDANDYSIKMANAAAGGDNLPKGITCHLLTHRSPNPCGSANHPCMLEEVRKTGAPVMVEHIHYDAMGNSRSFQVYGYPIIDAEGKVVQVIETALDITDLKNAEKEQERLRSELREAQALIETLRQGHRE